MKYSFVSKNISFHTKENVILHHANFSYKSGEIVCILGNNGSGKSTLLKICAGILSPTFGCVTYNDHSIFDLPLKTRTKVIGWLPQNTRRPYSLTLIDFLNLTPSSKMTEIIQLFELEKLLLKDISSLSGGEWKRAQLCRLWQSNCKVMLLDEPDSDLDLRHKKRLKCLFQDYAKENNAVILCATHDIIFAREVSNHICALVDGRLVWSSTNQDFWNLQVVNKIFSAKVI